MNDAPDTKPVPPDDDRPDQPPAGADDASTALRAPLSRGKKLLFSLSILLMLLIGAEAVCRLLGLGRAEEVAHYVSEWHNTPDGRTFWVVRGEGYNREGMRDRDHEVAKPPNTFRIICLGDSVTLGHGVKRSESYPFLLEAFFEQLGLPLRFEVLTMAASGWSTLQEATAYRELARKYAPDQVFLGLCFNDVAEMQNNLTRPPPGIVSLAMRHSALARWTVNARGREVHSVRELFHDPEPPAVAAGWERVFAQLLVLRDDVAADGAALSVVIFPFRFQLEPGAPPPVAQAKVAAFCRRHEIPCFDMLDVLRAAGPGAMIDESHLSPEGSRLVAEALIRWGQTGCMMCGLDLVGLPPGSTACPRCDWPTQ
jgi:lysophospholipase L1-like esterase